MQRKELRAAIAVILGGISAYMRILAVPLMVLLAVMIVDYVSGMMKAWVHGDINSRKGLYGIVRKISCLMLICAASFIDWLVGSGMKQLGFTLDLGYCFGLTVTVWLVINELISVLENLAALEVPMPAILRKVVDHLKNAVDDKKGSDK